MPFTLPHDASTDGHHVDAALGYLTVTTGLVFLVMASVLMVTVLFHRGPKRQAHYTHGTRARDRLVAAAAGAVVLLGIDAVAVVGTSASLRRGFWNYPDGDATALRVEVTGQQWAWTFRYPGADAQFATADDIVTLNELRVPVGRPIYLQLTSKDVVHSFYLPNFRTKIDVIPGNVTRLWFQARETGVFEIACAQHCGAWHYKMRGELAAMPADAFALWSARAAADAGRVRQANLDAAATSPAAAGDKVAPANIVKETKLSDGWAWIPAP